MTPSDAVDQAVALAETRGNAVTRVTTGWARVHAVVHMATPLDAQLRALLARDPCLRGWTTEPTLHAAAETGFTDDATGIALVFPLEATPALEAPAR